MRTIANLLNLNGRVYVYVPSKNLRRLFLKNAGQTVLHLHLILPIMLNMWHI